MKVEDYQIAAINKFANSKFVLDEYPMIDHIDISYIEAFPNQLWIRIILNSYDITKDNMLKMGLDPKALVENHLRPFVPFFELDENFKLDSVVVDPSNKPISVHFDNLNI